MQYLVIARFPVDDVPLELCPTLKHAQAAAASYLKDPNATRLLSEANFSVELPDNPLNITIISIDQHGIVDPSHHFSCIELEHEQSEYTRMQSIPSIPKGHTHETNQ